MKKLFIFFVLSIITLPLSAQHVRFMGIPMGTHINTFRKSILSKGYRHFSSSDAAPNIYYFDGGTFCGYRVSLNVQVTPKTKKVYDVHAIFSDFFHFKSGFNPRYGVGVSIKDITDLFYNLSTRLTQKYGNYFDFNPNNPVFIKWRYWHTRGGYVSLIIACYDDYPDCVKIAIDYSDESTRSLNDQEEADDL